MSGALLAYLQEVLHKQLVYSVRVMCDIISTKYTNGCTSSAS
jgi:hypothetical protein